MGLPVVADFDGDLADEVALFDRYWDPANDLWRFPGEAPVAQPKQTDLTSLTPFALPGDYDGDLSVDLARWYDEDDIVAMPGQPDISWPGARVGGCLPVGMDSVYIFNVVILGSLTFNCYADPANCPPGITPPS